MAEATQQVVIEYIAKVDKLQADIDKLNQLTEDLNKGAKKAGETITEEVGNKPSKGVETLKEKFNQLVKVIVTAFAVKKVGDFITSCLQAATAAQGIKIVFDKLNDPALLSKLRSAVSGTVSDFNLMKIAIKANNFKIPLQDLAKLFEFAKIKADETGQSVEILADTIVQSVGRNSTRALVELGISQESINQKVKETGSLYKGITAIIDSELAKQGEHIDSVADKQDRLKASIENTKVELGEKFLPLMATFLDGLNFTAGQLIELFDKNHISQNEFLDQQITEGKKNIEIYKEFGDVIADVENKRIAAFKATLGEGKKTNAELLAAQRSAFTELDKDIASSSARQEDYSQAVVVGLKKAKENIDLYVAANKEIPVTEEEKAAAAERTNEILADQKSLVEKLAQQERDYLRTLMTAKDAEIDKIKESYAEQRELAHGKSDLLIRLDEAEKNAISVIDEKYAKEQADFIKKNLDEVAAYVDKLAKENDVAMKTALAKLKDLNEKKKALNEAVFDATHTDQENELHDLDNFYLELIRKEEVLGHDTTEIKKAWSAKRKEITEGEQEYALESFVKYADDISAIFNVINGYIDASANHQIDILQKANEQGILSDFQYAEQRKKILEKQAKEDKAFAVFQAGIQVPQAILSAIPEGPAAVVLASILAFAQLAAIIETPLPSFKKGIIDFRGRGTGESDENIVKISNRESIITAKGTIKHKAALEAINKDTFDDYILRLYLPKLVKSSTGANSLTFDDSEIVKAQYRAIQESNQNSKRLLKVLSSNQNIRRN